MKNLYNPFMPDVSMRPQGMVFGGGGGGTTSSSSVPDWAQPYIESSLGKAVSTEAAGGFGHVEDLNPEQIAALTAQKELGSQGGIYDQVAADSYGATQAYRDAAGGTGLFGSDALGKQATALEKTIGQAQAKQLGGLQGQHALGGALGSARAQAASAGALTNTAGDIAQKELEARRNYAITGAGGTLGAGSSLQNQFGAGAQTLGDVGSTLQSQGQREGDSAYQGVQRLFGLYGNPAIGSKTTQTGGGK